jgi:tetratricopeptide (TPR) repeat protein
MGRSAPTPTWSSVILAGILFLALVMTVIPARGDSPSEIAAGYVQKGDDLTLQKRYLEALPEYEKAVATDPYNSIAWNKLGKAHMNTGRFQDAVLAFDRALTLDPYSIEAWNNKGDSLAMLGEYAEAISTYDRALLVNPNNLYALLKKGVCLQESGSPGEAMGIYEDVITRAEREMRRHPQYARYDAQLWTNKGDALSRLGRYEEAVDAYSTALAINPKVDRAILGKTQANDAILLARGSPPTPRVTEIEAEGISIPITPLPVPVPTLIGALVTAVFLLGIRRSLW